MLEEIDTLWRTAPLRAEKPSPVDEVRSIMAVFDETLYTSIPAVYRRDRRRCCRATTPADAPAGRAALRAARHLGRRRPRRQPVRHRRRHQAGRGDRERARAARPRAHRGPRRPHAHPRRDHDAAVGGRCSRCGSDSAPRTRRRPPRSRSARRTSRTAACSCCSPAASPRRGPATPTSPTATRTSCSPTCASCRTRSSPPGAARQAYGHLQQFIWQVETFGFHLAELEVRQHSAIHRKVLAELEAGGPLSDAGRGGAAGRPDDRADPAALRPARGRPLHRVVHAVGRGPRERAPPRPRGRRAERHPAGARRDPAVRDVRRPAGRAGHPRRDRRPSRSSQSRLDATGRRLEVMLGYSDSSKDVGPVAATLALYEAQRKIATWARRRTTSCSPCSTAAAARSAAAAARRTPRSSRSRRTRSTAASSSPSRAR